MKNTICLFLIIISFFSCKEKKLTGIYVANHYEGSDTLILNKDSSYIHNFILKGGKKFSDKGKWESGEEIGWIDFQNFNFHLKGIGNPIIDTTAIGYWSVEVKYDILNNSYLTINDDLGWKFKKIK